VAQRLISMIYLRGDESAAHYVRTNGDRSSNWANVPRNKRASRKMGKASSINVAQHEWECKHGYGSAFTYIDNTPMSDEDVMKMMEPIDPLVALFSEV
jgi:hypothetical protein